jgi:hypothetical protein
MYNKMPEYCPLLLIAGIALLISCGKKKNFGLDKAIIKEYPVLFTTSQPMVSDAHVSCRMQLRSSLAGDTLFFAALVDNSSADTLKVNPYGLQLTTSKNYRSDVARADPKNTIIAPGSADTLKFKFTPVNNPLMYSRITYRGDMDSVYTILLNFISRNDKEIVFGGNVKFSLDKGQYRRYLSDFAREKKMTLYEVENKALLKQQLLSNLKLLNHQRGKDIPIAQVEIFPGDMLIQGIGVKLNYYQYGSLLFLRAGIINHGGYTLHIRPSQFLINAAGALIKPCQMISSENPSPKNDYIIRAGERLELNLQYTGISTHRFCMLNTGMVFAENDQALFPKNVAFEADTARLH